ncbi:MAG TPA: RagB/SusD family nutrient uptake outer membrane protein [Puia sp.]
MKKHIIRIAAVLLVALSACKKSFLDEKVYSIFTPAVLVDSLAFDAAVVGVQSQYALWHTIVGDPYDSEGWLCVWQMGTDVAYNKEIADLDPFAIPYTNYENLTSTDPAALFAWKWAYNIINNCNVIIANIGDPKLVMGQQNKDNIKGEACFYRAVAYNTLATVFGKVPLITAPSIGPKTDFVRAPLADVNKLIVADLTFAKTGLPPIEGVKSNSGGKMYARANRSMASQLLAEVYLRMGGNDALAEAECDAVINSGDFSLTTARYGIRATQPGDAFSDMFIYGNERRSQGNREAIWVYEMEDPTTVVGGVGVVSSANFPGFIFGDPQQLRVWGSRYYRQAGMLLCDSLGGRGISRMALTDWVLHDLYGNNDMRNSQYNIRRVWYYNNPSFPLYGQAVVPGPGIDTNRAIVPITMKWAQYNHLARGPSYMIKDIILMRLGETYLLKAEAQLKQSNLAGAATTLNILRARANAAPITATDVTMDFILDERVRELVAEENRRMTLMRTGTLLSRVVGRGQKITGLTANQLLLPIPELEIQLNKDAVLDQNPGY